MVLTSRCSSCLLHIHDCSVLQRECGWTTWHWVEGPSLSWRSPVPAQGLQHRLPGLACWSNCPRCALTASNKPKHWSSRGRCSPTKVRRCINNLIWQCVLSPSLTTQYISPSYSDALENRIFRCEHSPCTTSHQRNFAAKGMTTNHKISRRCHSSVREPWIQIESLESGQKYPSFQLFVTGDLQDATHQSANALVCFCHKPNFASYCRTPSNVSKTSMAQDSKLWGEEPEGTTWTTCRAVRKITQKKNPLNSYCNGTRCSDLPTVKWFEMLPASYSNYQTTSCKTKIEHLRAWRSTQIVKILTTIKSQV